ncbi:cell envelope integrity protein TolA [Agaribacter marinus]|uniref:Cell envelope integrity protein TolA n=1 Tax=Agaribacter marinus TaxID=1431249 RepID=A0AA37SZG6_9ALTE|nr:cell envelope integrity protein TolA [Agaribacter marinus]GLR72067.1 hypothetical protein GCM10007852_29750 [Agaribacter marinus]
MKENKALGISFGLHVLLVIALVVSISFDSPKMVFASAQVQPVKAVFIDSQALADKKRKQQEAQAQARQQEQARKDRIKKQQQEKERKRKLERERKRKEDAARKKREDDARKKAEQAQKKRDEQKALERAKQEEAEFQRRVAEEKAKQEALEKEMAEQLAKEQAAIAEAQQKRVMTELDKYRALIYQTIYQNLFVDDGAKGKECRLTVKLASNGLVIDTKIEGGDAAICRAAQSAVLRPETLPVSKDPAVFEQMKTLKLTVKL